MAPSEFERLLAELRPVLGAKLNTLKTAHTLGSPDTRSAIEAWLQIQAGRLLGRRVGESPNLLAPPLRESVRGPFTLGMATYHERELYPVGVDERALLSHVGVFGRTGTGKTNFCLSLLKQLKDRKVPFLIFDWKRNYRDLLADMADLRVFTVGRAIVPFAFQPLIPPKGTSPSIWLKLLIDVIASAYYVGEGVKYLLMKAIDGVYREMGVYGGVPPVWPSFRDVLLWMEEYRPANARESQWMISTMRTLQSLCYGEMGRIVNKPQQTPLAELLSQNVVLELDALTQTDKTFLTEALLLWIHHYRMQEDGRETLKHVIVVEEAHHVLKETPAANESIMEVVLREIRELGEGMILIDQTPSQISPTALANTATKVYLNLPHRSDITTAAAALLLQDEQKDILGRLPVGMAVVKLQDKHYTPFLMRIPHVRINKGKVTDKELAQRFPQAHSESEPETAQNDAVQASEPVEATGVPSPAPVAIPNSAESAAIPPDNERIRKSVPESVVSARSPARTRKKASNPPSDKAETDKISAGAPAADKSDASLPNRSPQDLTDDERRLLEDIARRPYDSGINARYGRLGMSTRRGARTKKGLEDKGLVTAEDVPLPRGKVTLLPLTKTGRARARRLGIPLPPLTNTSPAHEYWRHQTILFLERQGYTVEREVRIPGDGLVDLCATKGNERLAVEIETGKSDIRGNLTKALEDGFTGVVLVAVSPQAERRSESLVEGLSSRHKDKVRVWTARNLLRDGGETRRP